MGSRIIIAMLGALLAGAAHAATSVTLSYSGDALVYDGELSAAANQRLFALYDAATVKPHTLVISSSGGAFNLGLALGEWVAQHRLRVHVPRYCNSACANYVFTAASQRELGGGPQGTGLGLAIVDHTMRGHGGFVRVDSEPDKGSTFSLHFPIPSENAFQGTLAESIR